MAERSAKGVAFFTNNRILPFPGDTLRLVIPSAAYVSLLLQGASANNNIVVSTMIGDQIVLPPEFTISASALDGGGEIVFSRYAAVAVVNAQRRDEIIRRADSVLLPLSGIAFMRIDEAIPKTATTAAVRGNIFFIDSSTPVDSEVAANFAANVAAYGDKLADIIAFFSSHGNAAAEMVENNLGNIDGLIRTKITEALSAISRNNFLEAAGKVLSVATLATEVTFGDIIVMLDDASSGGNEDIPLNEYVKLALRALLLTYDAAQQLYNITASISDEERKQITLTSLQRLQQAIEKRIGEMLGIEGTNPKDEILAKLEEVNPPPAVRAYIEKEARKLGSGYLGLWAEAEVTLKHINFLLSLPWNKRAESRVDISDAIAKLDARLFGLRKAKERVIEYLATMHHLNVPAIKGTTLCFVGPPGTGKTDLARQIAHALQRPLGRIALGGVNDEANIKGHRRTYVGAMPGDIMKTIAKCGVKNPVIVLDEVDKMRVGVKGDPVAALMDALDPEFNHEFVDFFVDFPFDLSEVLFICTANNAANIPKPLLDRLEIIEFRPYTFAEKKVIAMDYLIPRIREELKCPPDFIQIEEDAIDVILSNYTLEGGVRELYRVLKRIFMKSLIPDAPRHITAEQVSKFLWDITPQVWKLEKKQTLDIGMAPTLGVLGESGEGCVTYIMIDVVVMGEDGKEEDDVVVWTTNADQVAQQSVIAGLRVARKIASKLGKKIGKVKWIVHSTRPFLHTTGSSWGVSAAMAALSALLQRPLPPNWSYTGEIDITGHVYAVGGIATKIATADLLGFDVLYVPQENYYDVAALDFSPQVRITFVDNIQTIVDDWLSLRTRRTKQK